MVCTK